MIQGRKVVHTPTGHIGAVLRVEGSRSFVSFNTLFPFTWVNNTELVFAEDDGALDGALGAAGIRELNARYNILVGAMQSIIMEAGPQYGHNDEPGTINAMARTARRALNECAKVQA
jgi:hypothetical protein